MRLVAVIAPLEIVPMFSRFLELSRTVVPLCVSLWPELISNPAAVALYLTLPLVPKCISWFDTVSIRAC